jgi:hypothetical protein
VHAIEKKPPDPKDAINHLPGPASPRRHENAVNSISFGLSDACL